MISRASVSPLSRAASLGRGLSSISCGPRHGVTARVDEQEVGHGVFPFVFPSCWFGGQSRPHFVRDFHFDLPDGHRYTPEALPNEPNCSSSHQLPTQEPLRRTRVDMQLTEISVPTDTTPCLSLFSPAASLDARQPVGNGSAQSRQSIVPKRRRVRWLSASNSQ